MFEEMTEKFEPLKGREELSLLRMKKEDGFSLLRMKKEGMGQSFSSA